MEKLKRELKKHANPKRAEHDSRYFKTGPGEYGEGRISLGIETKIKRQLAKKYSSLPLDEIRLLLRDRISDYKFLALVILHNKYKKADGDEKKRIVDFYLKNTREINNWDLVDISAHHILGNYLLDKDKGVLYKLARSKDLWEKRIAIISTFAFIRVGQFDDTLKIAEILLGDSHDLIHKAVGWMLREVGKKNQKIEEEFLRKHYKKMPRTMLRYAIERFDEDLRLGYLRGKI